MTRNDLNLLIDAMRVSKGTYAIKCVTTWNGFEAGQIYHTELARDGAVMANDKDGISTAIGFNSCTFFELSSPLPSQKDTLLAERRLYANKLKELSAHLLTDERDVFGAGELVEWKPGMCNLNTQASVFCVVEQVEPFVAKPQGSPFDSGAIELLDLRVAFLHSDNRLNEIFMDSRRVRKAEGL